MTPDTSGLGWLTPFAIFDPDTSCWRTSQATFLSGSDLYSEVWPRSGTTRSGCAYELPMPALPTVALVSSSTPGTLLSTPQARDYKGRPADGFNTANLVRDVQDLLPTPGVAGGGKKIPEDAVWSGKAAYKQDGRKVQVHLDQIAKLLPTPAAHDSGNTPQNHLRKKPGRSQVTSLQVIADYGLIPTGGRIDLPSSGGSASLDDQLLGQLSLVEPLSDSAPPSSSG